MRKLLIMSAALFVAAVSFAQVRGVGRLQGVITDKTTGKGVAGATITVNTAAGNTQPIVVKSDSRGRWAALGLTNGVWNIDITASGYVMSRGSAAVSEMQVAPPIKTQLEPEARKEAAATVPTAPSVPKEAVDAIREGQELLKVKAGDVVTTTQAAADGSSTAVSHTVTAAEVQENAKRSVADLEKALPMIPEDTPELKDVKNQVLQVLAQAYYRAGDVPGAIGTLERLEVADPWTATADAAYTTREVLLANLYLENGQLDKGKAILDKLPPSAITDPTAFINIGILFLNKKNPADAATYFSKAVALDAKRADSYYYRGLAELQLRQNKEAKADLEQVVALSPDSPEAHDAKQLLANLK
ncbi:MAG TPA: tetratricopeptide repeat protein [Thermoanaerobaculia bacterium]|nr:tetratricopeptide repeat protein [Thermoanaerobaculia bacterium]